MIRDKNETEKLKEKKTIKQTFTNRINRKHWPRKCREKFVALFVHRNLDASNRLLRLCSPERCERFCSNLYEQAIVSENCFNHALLNAKERSLREATPDPAACFVDWVHDLRFIIFPLFIYNESVWNARKRTSHEIKISWEKLVTSISAEKINETKSPVTKSIVSIKWFKLEIKNDSNIIK